MKIPRFVPSCYSALATLFYLLIVAPFLLNLVCFDSTANPLSHPRYPKHHHRTTNYCNPTTMNTAPCKSLLPLARLFGGSENQILRNAQQIGLDVAIDHATVGDGNCWYRSIIEQMRRPEILAVLDPSKVFVDHHALRLAIVQFVRDEEPTSLFIQHYRMFYEQTISAEHNNMTWDDFLNDQERNRTYCTELFTHATAVFLDNDIMVTSESFTTFTRLSRSWDIKDDFSPCPMLVGNICQNHFQSLVLTSEMSSMNFACESTPVDTLLCRCMQNDTKETE